MGYLGNNLTRYITAQYGDFTIKSYKYENLTQKEQDYLNSCAVWDEDGLIAIDESDYNHYLNGLSMDSSDEDIINMINEVY